MSRVSKDISDKKCGYLLKMRMIPKLRDNWMIVIMKHNDNTMTAMHLPMLTQIQRISESPEMRPFATILLKCRLSP